MMRRGIFLFFVALVLVSPAMAQEAGAQAAGAQAAGAGLSSLLSGLSGGGYATRLAQLIGLTTILSIAPGILVTVTSFTRFVIAFSFLRSGIGLQSTPANLVLISLSLFMTFYVMGPTFDQAWKEGVRPFMEEKIGEAEAFDKTVRPLRVFMMQQVRDKDLALFISLDPQKGQAFDPQNPDLRVLVPAYMISELRRGFEIGFLVALPFLVIDLVVATLVMSAGMMMMPPSVISLPVKVIFFVLVDGWHLLVGSLVRSYN